jgi:hypothetical protein
MQVQTLNLAKSIISGETRIISIELGLKLAETINKPSVRTVFKNNEPIAFNFIETLVTRFLDSFGFSTKPDKNQIEMIAVDAFEKFAYESLEDIILFFKMARAGEFGTTKRGVDSNLIFGEWFPIYLEKKSILRQQNHDKQKNELNKSTTSYVDVAITYQEAAKKRQLEKETETLLSWIDKITKDFDRQMLEDLIIEWDNDEKKKHFTKYLKRKRRTIK